MKPSTIAQHSKWFGHMGNLGGPTQRGVVVYTLSHFQQRAFAGALKHGIFNTARRTFSQIPYILPAIVLAYTVYNWGNDKHKYLNSKAGLASEGASGH